MKLKIAILAGDGIGPEIMQQGVNASVMRLNTRRHRWEPVR